MNIPPGEIAADLCDVDTRSLTLDQARARLLEWIEPIQSNELLPIEAAGGRVLAEAVLAVMNAPPFRASSMDGYALRHADGVQRWRLVGTSLAGHPGPDKLGPGECVRITTGARVPDDADTIIVQEQVQLLEIEGTSYIELEGLPRCGVHVRPVGSDCASGDRLLDAGQTLRAATQALLAAHGVGQVKVIRTVRIGVLSTGDELHPPGISLPNGGIHESNRMMIRALLESSGVEVLDFGIVPDQSQAIAQAFDSALESNVDLIVSSGGVSVGSADLVRDVITVHGKIDFFRIAMRPGRPLTFGRWRDHTPFLGLPGNPVSSAVTALMFVQPAVRRLQGIPYQPALRIQARLSGAIAKNPGRLDYQRGILSWNERGECVVKSSGQQDSYRLHSLATANCLIELPLELGNIDSGTILTVLPFASTALSGL